MKHSIIGDDMQALILDLDKGEQIFAEAGSMMYMKGSVEIDAEMKGGFLGGVKRLLQRESLFLVRFDSTGDDAEVAFAPPYPGHIKHVEMNGNTLVCQKDAFICSVGNIESDITFVKRLGFGFFGGEGFILQKITGKGDLFIHAGGNFVEKELAENEEIKVDTGCIVAMDESVDYDIKSVGNIKTSIFAGEGLFVAHLKGPGKVWLQTLPFSRMAEKIASAVGRSKGESRGAAGVGGEIFKSIVSGH
ncbi:TIGR00266 family protein [Candidatus Dojkabacteria bacterium]|nr:TIGR00266 family protein [Candidatus Dojkabacteria bacterium]